jgi:hypothetical protein
VRRAHDGRDETQNERMDRNWNDLLQELRVTQTARRSSAASRRVSGRMLARLERTTRRTKRIEDLKTGSGRPSVGPVSASATVSFSR